MRAALAKSRGATHRSAARLPPSRTPPLTPPALVSIRAMLSVHSNRDSCRAAATPRHSELVRGEVAVAAGECITRFFCSYSSALNRSPSRRRDADHGGGRGRDHRRDRRDGRGRGRGRGRG
eukprot:CAMPEP_0183353520 /NCGR_PEP_ID=MMETSP0164_2-20130417/33382_1 /TAXON_ID=221442 /ORGANISM="Coccolithus pelagicus ssp braarudi, Strain PLY182g" /LENGTH=120 /DNA_ID=CAMNT_0025526195 /DNA_START=445 /DNA_END=803 /DNA_ORIENTATION=-